MRGVPGRYLNIKGGRPQMITHRYVTAMQKCNANNIKIVNAASTDEQVRYEFDKS